MLTLLLIGTFTFASNVHLTEASSSTIYIRTDGSVDPVTTLIRRNGNRYVLTGNIRTALDNDGIVIEMSNVTFDGGDYTIQGAVLFSYSKGICLSKRSNVTIRNVRVDSFYYGIYAENCSNNEVVGNNMTNNSEGIEFSGSSNNRVSGNTLTKNDRGIVSYYSSSNVIAENSLANNNYGILLVKSINCTIAGNSLMGSNRDGVCFVSSSGNSVVDNNVTGSSKNGVFLDSSLNNSVSGNIVAANGESGIVLRDNSDSNRLFENSIRANEGNGIVLSGIDWLSGPSDCNVSWNTITENGRDGVELDGSSGNRLVGNNVARNLFCLDINESSNNFVYHNNFVDNTNRVSAWKSLNVWNSAVEGNYWSEYTGGDLDRDGVGESPCVICENNTDNRPLMNPFMIGDVNHDAKVNIVDINIVGRSMGTERGDKNWNPHADVDENGKVSLLDLAVVAREFGKQWNNP
jgi:parallel beta-helix repeat protein